MFGLGCSTEVKEMWKYMKQPKQFATALFLQLVVMPCKMKYFLCEIYRVLIEAFAFVIHSKYSFVYTKLAKTGTSI